VSIAPASNEFRIFPSDNYQTLVGATHLLIFLALLVLDLSWTVRGLLIIALLASAVVSHCQYALVNNCWLAPEDQGWKLVFPENHQLRVKCSLLFKCRWLLLLSLENEYRRWVLPVFADSMKPGDFRRLCREVS